MLIGTALLSFVLYATVYPSVWAASLAFTFAIVALSISLIRSFVSVGSTRRFCLTFGLVGFAYLALLYVPVLDERIGARLVTTIGFAGLESSLYIESADRPNDPRRPVMHQRYAAGMHLQTVGAPDTRNRLRSFANVQILPQESWAGQTFHSAIAILCGLVAVWIVKCPLRSKTATSGTAAPMVE